MSSLTIVERTRLTDCMMTVSNGMKTFVEVGTALGIMREERLYRETHASFEAFCKEHWDCSKTQANRMISASQVAEITKVTPNGCQLPPILTSERQARPLTKLLEQGGEEVAECWKDILDTAPKNESGQPVVTAKFVEETVKARITPPEPKSEEIVDMENWNSQLRIFSSRVKKFAKEQLPKGPWLDESRVKIATQQFDTAIATFMLAKGYASCPKCDGGCKVCRNTGYLPKAELDIIS